MPISDAQKTAILQRMENGEVLKEIFDDLSIAKADRQAFRQSQAGDLDGVLRKRELRSLEDDQLLHRKQRLEDRQATINTRLARVTAEVVRRGLS